MRASTGIQPGLWACSAQQIEPQMVHKSRYRQTEASHVALGGGDDP